ncbi:uncharacterized protein LOC143290594 isoform X2 [Babylonia areolata]|uniref:uncharacterized protein LOC143290594 isoform X2 n=1 Tax=Babylonia areolata TaxID=304850 RepID=UPI003FD13455
MAFGTVSLGGSGMPEGPGGRRMETCRGRGRRRRRGRSGVQGRRRVPVLFILLWGAAVTWAQNTGPGPVNVATNLPLSAYSVNWTGGWHDDMDPGKAADGNTNRTGSGCIMTDSRWYWRNREGGESAVHTFWWEVDLGKPHYIYHIRIWGYFPWRYQLGWIEITVDGTVCRHMQLRRLLGARSREATVNCNQPIHGQLVRFSRTVSGRQIHYHPFGLCEFEIFVCNPGYYGENCTLPCPCHCSPQGCYMNDGQCINCESGTYGADCQKKCGPCKDGAACDRETGHCEQCDPGWLPPSCRTRQAHVCNPGYYGENCTLSCPSHCSPQGCYMNDGQCISHAPDNSPVQWYATVGVLSALLAAALTWAVVATYRSRKRTQAPGTRKEGTVGREQPDAGPKDVPTSSPQATEADGVYDNQLELTEATGAASTSHEHGQSSCERPQLNIYDKSAVYGNTTDDPQPYATMQSSTDDLYEICE